jgi:hypothetical protein
MAKTSLALSVVFTLSLTLSLIRTAAQPSEAPPSGDAASQTNSQQPQQVPSEPKRPDQERPATTQTEQPASPPVTVPQVFGPPNQTEPPTTQEQSKGDQFLDKLIDPILWVTVAIAFFAFWQVRVYRQMRDHTQIVERAYVDISHDPPGLQMGNDIRFSVAVKNHGRTPTDVTPPVMFLALEEGDELPDTPPYGAPTSAATSAFLMPNEAFHQWELRPQFPATDVAMINTGQRHLWLIGYVDYVDKFGHRHRSGYARKYIPTPLPGTQNNLVFITKPGYNYDIEIDEQGHPKRAI